MRKILYLFVVITLSACSDGSFIQNYATISDFNNIKSNKRLSGWFPNIITYECYDLRSTSYLDYCAFSSIKYKNFQVMDSIFNSNEIGSKIEFKNVYNLHIDKIPKWFIKFDKLNNKDLQIIKLNKTLIARNKNSKEIFSIVDLE